MTLCCFFPQVALHLNIFISLQIAFEHKLLFHSESSLVAFFSPTADKPDSPPAPSVLEAEPSSPEPSVEKEDDAPPAESDAAPTAETQQSSEQPSSGAVLITDFETVAYCKSPAHL